jgi:hypothetical protein
MLSPWRLARLFLQGDDLIALFRRFDMQDAGRVSAFSVDRHLSARYAEHNGLPLRVPHGGEGVDPCSTSCVAVTAPAQVILDASDLHAHVLQSFVSARISRASAPPFSGHWNDRHES